MHRFTRLATAWLVVGGLAALVVLHTPGTRRSAGSSPVTKPSHDAGTSTKLAAAPNPATSRTRPAIINSVQQPKAQASGGQAAISRIPGPADIPCSTTSEPAAPNLSSTINVTVAGMPESVSTVDNANPQRWAGLSVDTSGVSGNVTPRLSPGSEIGSVSFSGGVGQAQGSAAAGLLQGSGSPPLTFVIGVANDKLCLSRP